VPGTTEIDGPASNDTLVYFSARGRWEGPFKDVVYVKSLRDASGDASYARTHVRGLRTAYYVMTVLSNRKT